MKPVTLKQIQQNSGEAMRLIRLTQLLREKFSNDTC